MELKVKEKVVAKLEKCQLFDTLPKIMVKGGKPDDLTRKLEADYNHA